MNKNETGFVLDRKRQLLIIMSVAFSSFMSGLNNYIVNVSLPAISKYFSTGTAEVSRIVIAFLLTITSSLLFFGRLGDRVGLKRIFITGYIVFTAGSLLCGLAGSINMLVGFRLLQGIGSAMLISSGVAIIAKLLPPERTGQAYGIISSSVALGITTGAPLGGIIAGYLSWHWIFFVNVPVGIVASVIAVQCIPQEIDKNSVTGEKREGFDIPGALLSFFGLGTLLYGMNTGKTAGWTSSHILISFALAILLLACFVMRELRSAHPLLDFGLLKNPAFAGAIVTTAMAFMLISANAFLFPFYLEIVRGLSTQQTGMVIFVYALVHVFLSPSVGKLADRGNPRKLVAAGMLSAAFSVFFFVYTMRLNSLIPSFVFIIWIALSYVFFFAPNSKRIMHLASEGKHGAASGLFNTATFMSMIFGVAIFEAVFSRTFSEMLQKGVSIFGAGISQQLFLKGFSEAYILGGAVSFVGFLFAMLGRD